MIPWEQRPIEEANLFNPAFCGECLRRTIYVFNNTSDQYFPYPLSFLVLPIVLHKATRELISPNSRERLHVWLQSNQRARIGFTERARSLVDITNESIKFLLLNGIVEVENEGTFKVTKNPRPIRTVSRHEEVLDCFRKAEIVGRWLARGGTIENIYTMWGIMP